MLGMTARKESLFCGVVVSIDCYLYSPMGLLFTENTWRKNCEMQTTVVLVALISSVL